jgi:hypothetical protein
VSRSLWPREHGAYAQLLAPLVTALVVMPPTWQAGLLALAACCAFLANEPLLVVLGHRGKRMRENDGVRAKRRLALLVAIAAAASTIALAGSPRRVLEVAGVVALPAVATLVLAWRRAEKSVAGEIVAAVALSGASAVVLVASGASWQAAGALWGAWAVGYACTVVAVHRVIARHRAPASAADAIAGAVLAAVSVATVALLVDPALLADTHPAFATIGAAAPLAAASLVLVAWPPRATYLRTIGFVLVGASLCTCVLAFVMLR